MVTESPQHLGPTVICHQQASVVIAAAVVVAATTAAATATTTTVVPIGPAPFVGWMATILMVPSLSLTS